MAQSRKIEVDATDDGVAGIVAAGEGEEFASIEDRHCEVRIGGSEM